MDVPRFLQLLALPPDDPDSLHPALLNSTYLAACCLAGGRLATFEPYFVQQTRLHLQQSLAFADRLTHFLWASIILGSYLARVHRLRESYAVISSASRFALACGLDGSNDETAADNTDPDTGQYLLPPPKDYTEAIERIRLAHSIYLTDRSLAMLSGYPSAFVFNENWAHNLAVRAMVRFQKFRAIQSAGDAGPRPQQVRLSFPAYSVYLS